MKKLNEIIDLLNRNKFNIQNKFGVKKLGIFGSYVRGSETEKSDIDILVEFEQGFKTFDNYMDLKFYLEDLLNIKVDLISITALKPKLKEKIVKEVVYV